MYFVEVGEDGRPIAVFDVAGHVIASVSVDGELFDDSQAILDELKDVRSRQKTINSMHTEESSDSK